MFKIHKTLKISLFILFTTIIMSSNSFNCFATTYTAFSDLIENGKTLDGKKLSIKGEAIGEPMKRGTHTWINISDGGTAMGLWIKNEDADKVKVFGNYKKKGDIIEANAVFHRACKDHAGDMDLHVEKLSIVKPGYYVNKTINSTKAIAAPLLSALTLLLVLAYRKKYHK